MKKKILLIIFVVLFVIILFEVYSIVKLTSKIDDQKKEIGKCPVSRVYHCTKDITVENLEYSYFVLEEIVIDSFGTVKEDIDYIVYDYKNRGRYLEVKNENDEDDSRKHIYNDDKMRIIIEVKQEANLVEQWYRSKESFWKDNNYSCQEVTERLVK